MGSILGGSGLILALPVVSTQRAKDRLAAGGGGRLVGEGRRSSSSGGGCRTALGSKHAGIGGRRREEGDSACRPARCCNTDPQGRPVGRYAKNSAPKRD